jgi:hypothetical protein
MDNERDKTESGYVCFWSETHRILSKKYSNKKELIGAMTAIMEEQPAQKLMHHVANELILRPSDEKLDGGHVSTWGTLEKHFQDASVAFENDDISKACWSFYWMGIASQELQTLTFTQLISAHKAEIEKLKRERPLVIKAAKQKEAKEFVQHIAKNLWTTEKWRLSEMANNVWGILVDGKYLEKFDGLPNDANGLKPWLREISPPFAKKRGR